MGLENKKNTNMPSRRSIILFLQGCIIGVGGILPGISGGVLCVVFGLYRPIIETLSDPIHNFKKYWHLILPTAVGIGIGFLGLARITSVFMEKNNEAAVCVFIGLILGMIPDLWRDAGKEGRSKASIGGMLTSLTAGLAFFFYLRFAASISVEPNLWWYLFCGAAWGLSIVVPGMSSSSILIFLGLYQPMLEGVSRLSPEVIFPLGAGVLIIIFTLSKGIHLLYQKYYAMVSHVIIGIIIATTVPIIPGTFAGPVNLMIDILCLAGGCATALLLSRLMKKIS